MKRMSIACGFLLVATAALAALPGLAEEQPVAACQPVTAEAITAVAVSPEGADQARKGNGVGGVETQSTCQASCWNGTSVSCSGSSCSAYDSSCGNGFRGYCTGSTSGTKYCPVCPGCTANATCPFGSSISCTGTYECQEYPDCWVSCDGVVTECFPQSKYGCPFPT